jgi:hypothetical protein
MSTPVWQAESKKDHQFVRRKACLAPLRFYIYIQLNFCLGVKSGKSNCTFVGQGLCSCPTMQQSIFMFIIEQP